MLYPPYASYASPRFMEWVMGGGASAAIWLSIAMTLIAPICFLAYALVMKDRKRRTKALIIALSFFALAFLVDFQEPLGAFMPLTLRRALVLITMALLYAGFNM
jgi:heme exporter protein D